MRKLDVQARLEFARCAVAVVRTLKITDQKITYKGLGIAIGLIADDEKWQPWHRQQTQDILNTAAAVEQMAGQTQTTPLEFNRVINERTAQPGAGIRKQSKIVRR